MSTSVPAATTGRIGSVDPRGRRCSGALDPARRNLRGAVSGCRGCRHVRPLRARRHGRPRHRLLVLLFRRRIRRPGACGARRGIPRCLPAFANLGASLGRDGDLPRWFAKGAESGAVPRRALGWFGIQSLVYTTLFFAFHLDLQTFILIHTSSMVAVYALGMVAAVRLLRRGSIGWIMAVISVVLTFGLLLVAGWHLIVPALLALVAVAVTAIRRFRAHARLDAH